MTEPIDPTAGHLDLETLADLDEGLLSHEQAAAAQVHLEGCAQCRDDLAALTSVRELLAADTIAMPDDVAARVHEALAAEPPLAPTSGDAEALAASTAADGYAPAAVTTLPQAPYDRERRRNQWLGGLAAAAVIALFVVGIAVLPHSSSSKSTGAAGTTSAGPAVVTVTTQSGRDYTRGGLGGQALALVGHAPASSAAAGASSAAGTTAAAASSAASSASASSAAASAAASSAPASAGPTVAGTSGAAASATSAASSAPSFASAGGGKPGHVNGGGSSGATSAAPAPTTDALAPLRKPGAAEACLSSYDSQAGPPLAIDFATFEGKPAVIGVFPDPSHPGQYEVVAVGPPGCSLYEFARPTTP